MKSQELTLLLRTGRKRRLRRLTNPANSLSIARPAQSEAKRHRPTAPIRPLGYLHLTRLLLAFCRDVSIVITILEYLIMC